jgi:hypothetical protein
MIADESCVVEYKLKGSPLQEMYAPELVAWCQFHALCADPKIDYVQIARLTVKHLDYYRAPPPEPINFEI